MRFTLALILPIATACATPSPIVDATTALVCPAPTPPVPLIAPTFFVVPTFDDTFADQAAAAAELDARTMHGTFFINSSRIGTSGYMTLADLQGIAAHGHEIGGHTLTHPHLTQLTTTQQQHEICDDRTALQPLGLGAITSFAYPFGDDNTAVQSVVAGCGYTRARDIGGAENRAGFCGSTPSCFGCAFGETAPTPRNKYEIRTAPTSVGPNVAGAVCDRMDVIAAIQGARPAGGVLVVNFHHVCNGCDPTIAFPVAEYTEVLDWIQGEGIPTETLAQAFP